MKKFLFALVALAVGIDGAMAASHSITRNDCEVSFIVPDGIEYVEVEHPIVPPRDVCEIAFNYMESKRKNSPKQIPMPDEWREKVDFWLTIRNIPLADQVKRVDSKGGGEQSGIFRLKSKTQLEISGGRMLVFEYSATRPTPTMRRLNQTREVILVAGDASRSVTFYIYPPGRNGREERKVQILKRLFASFKFRSEDMSNK